MTNLNNKFLYISKNLLINLVDSFIEQYERNPYVNEVIEVINYACKYISADIFLDVYPSNILSLKSTYNKNYSLNSTLNIFEVSDSVIVAANEYIVGLSNRINIENNEKLSSTDFFNLLAETIKTTNAIYDHEKLINIKPKKNPAKKVKVEIGDIIAIPRPTDNNKFYFCIILERNRFGTAFGFFKNSHLSFSNNLSTLPYCIVSGEDLIQSNKWLIIKNDPALLNLFKSPAEIYHKPDDESKYGYAEDDEGNLRKILKDEAEITGLISGSYRQTYLEDFLEKKLEDLVGV